MGVKLLAERYELLEMRGRAGATEVVRAVDRRHDRVVALKLTHLTPDEPRERYDEDSRALLDVPPHPSLPTVRDHFFLDDLTHVLVMDWVDATPLTRVLAERGDPGMPLGVVLTGMPTVADALEHLHAQDPPVLHGDVRPGTVLVGPGGRVSLVYGVRVPKPGQTGVAFPFAAPELGTDRESRAVDVFGLAATSVFALTGHAPKADRTMEWEGIAPELARRVERLIRRSLDDDPSRRPSGARDFMERLAATRETTVPEGVVTFLLTDVEGSTVLWERHPDVMASVMVRHYELAADIAERFGGRMPRSQGEGDSTLMAFVRASDAVDAVIELQRAMQEEPWPAGIDLRVRVALHTGEAQVEHGDYYGAALSRTARLRALARGTQVLLSQAAAEMVADRLPTGVQLRNLGPVRLKGLERAEHVHQLVGEGLPDLPPTAALLDATQAGDRLPLPLPLQQPGSGAFVGRGEQIATISRAWRRAIDLPARHVVTISGDPGIGKTRLTVEMSRQVHDDDEATVMHGRCYEENVVPYQPFVEAIEHYLRRGAPDEVHADLLRSGTLLARLVPDLAMRFPDLPAPIRAEPDTERYLMFEAVSTLLSGLAKRAPLMVVLEDLHWADQPTIALLCHLARSADAAPLMLLGTFRSGEVGAEHPLGRALADLRHDGLLDDVALPGMSEREVAELIERTCAIDARAEFVESVRRETAGNPFFVQEICSHVGDTGGASGTFTLETLGVPDGVKQVIERRIARLPEGAGRMLSVAAVIGRDFDLDLVVAASGIDEDTALDHLDLACAARIVEEVEGAVGRYTFVHALTREALYDSLSSSRRARLHRRVAEAIEDRSDPSSGEHLGALAHHYAESASELPKAIEYAHRAGHDALARLAHEEAGKQFERGLGLLRGSDTARCDLLLGLAEARRRSGDVPGSQEAFFEAATVARTIHDPARLARAAVGTFRGHVLASPDWHEPLIAMLEEALAALPEDERVLRSRVLAALALELYFTPQAARGITTSAEAIAIARAAGDDDALAFALACAHTAISDPAHLEQRLANATELIEVGERAGNPELALVGHVHRACDLLESARVDEVRREGEICDGIVEQLGQPMQRYFVSWLHATIARLEGRFDDSERLTNEALDIAVAADHPDALIVWGTQALILGFERGQTSHLLDAAERLLEELPDLSAWPSAVSLVRAVAGKLDDAHDLLRSQVARLDQLSFDAIWTPALMALTEVMRMVDDADGARQVYDMLEPYGDTICVVSLNLSEMGPVHRSLGVLATLLGEHQRAEHHFERALEMSTRIGAPPHVARASTDYARMLLGRGAEGDDARARDLLARARATATELGMEGLLRAIAALDG